MSINDIINIANKNGLPLDSEVVIADMQNKSIDNIYAENGEIVLEHYGY